MLLLALLVTFVAGHEEYSLDSPSYEFELLITEFEIGDVVAVLIRGQISSVVEGTAAVTYIDLGGSGHHPLVHLPSLPPHLSSVSGLDHQATLSPPRIGWSRLSSTALARATQDNICLLTMQDEAGLQVLVPRVGTACMAQLSMDKKHRYVSTPM